MSVIEVSSVAPSKSERARGSGYSGMTEYEYKNPWLSLIAMLPMLSLAIILYSTNVWFGRAGKLAVNVFPATGVMETLTHVAPFR